MHDEEEVIPLFLQKSAARPNGKARAKRSTSLQTLAILYFLSSLCYILSLRGARSPSEMSARQGYLGLLIILAVAFFSAQFWLAFRACQYFSRSCILQVTTVTAWYFFDNGNRLESHGAYNLLLFFLFLAPVNILIAILYFWRWLANGSAKPRRFWIQMLVVSLLLVMTLRIIALRKETALRYGFFNRTSPCDEIDQIGTQCKACKWDRATPWLDLIPFRLNFFTGPMTCPKDDSFSARFDGDRFVIEDCHISTNVVSYFNGSVLHSFSGAAYSVLPRTEAWGLSLKHDELLFEQNLFQENVLRYAEEHTQPYHGPTIMKKGFDTILARCGDAAPKIVHRVGFSAVLEEAGPSTTALEPGTDRLNVITVFIDAVSRNHFHRKMPLTRHVLENLATHRSSSLFELFRYHTVGFNTGPNTRALWAGLPETDPHAAGVPLWEQFEDAGYVAARINPMCQDWDAYYNPSHLPAAGDRISPHISHEYLAWSCLPPYIPRGKSGNGNFAGAYSLKARCISDTHVGWHTLDWASEFITAYDSVAPYYLHATFMEGHEGSGAVLSTLDARLAAFLDPSTSPINFATTAVVLVSDHGALMGLKSVLFANGKIEAASPLGALLLPQTWTGVGGREARLRKATGKLVTAHDIYETIRGFKGGVEGGREALEMQRGGARRGLDLARETLRDRSCKEAGITETQCRCK